MGRVVRPRSDGPSEGTSDPRRDLHSLARHIHSRTVSLLALELLERIFPASILQDRAILSPGVRLTAANWAIMWLFAVHFAAKMYYDVRATRRFVDI